MSNFGEELIRFVQEQSFEVIRLSWCENYDKIQTWEPKIANRCQNTYSVAKTFTMTAIGLLYDKGLVKPEDKVCDILRDELPAEGMDERWKDVTVHHLLTHSAGLPCGFLDIDCQPAKTFTGDFLRYMLTYPLEYTPGTDRKYSDGAFYLLAYIAEKLSGLPADDFLWRELLWEFECPEMAWSKCPKGHVMGATGLYIHAADMVKLGLLYLSGGYYRGKRYLSEEWCSLAIHNEYGLDWDATHTIFSKGGMYGQRLIIDPKHKIVVAMQANQANSQIVADWVRDHC